MPRHSMTLLTVNSGGYKTKEYSHQNMRDYSAVSSAAKELSTGYHTLQEQFNIYRLSSANTFSYTTIGNNYIFSNKAKFKNGFIANWKIKSNFSTEEGNIHTCSNPRYRGTTIDTISFTVSNNIRNGIDMCHYKTLQDISNY